MFPFYFLSLNSGPKKKNSNEHDIADWIGIMLFITGCVSFISSVIFMFIELPADETWFSRLCLSMGCFGIFAIIKKLTK